MFEKEAALKWLDSMDILLDSLLSLRTLKLSTNQTPIHPEVKKQNYEAINYWQIIYCGGIPNISCGMWENLEAISGIQLLS